MVEQTRQKIQVVSLQAGPGEVDTSILFDMNLRYQFNTITKEQQRTTKANTLTDLFNVMHNSLVAEEKNKQTLV